MKILHLTDLHLDDLTSTNENLRKAHYKEFLEELFEKIAQTIGTDIDLMVCTGDFVNKGKVQNFEHAATILDFLTVKFGLSCNDVAICIGNHDFIRTLDKAKEPLKARQEFYKLEEKFRLKEILVNKDFYKIYHDAAKTFYVITFDSTLGSNGENVPSSLSDMQIDEIITDIDEKVPIESCLFILSHYPMILFNRNGAAAEVDNWVDDHLWKSGHYIVERCFKKRKQSFTFWFFGDGHIADFWSYNAFHHFLMTGMIGGNYTNPTYKDSKSGLITPFNKTNEVKVIEFDRNNSKVKIHSYSYKSQAYNFNPHTGYWEYSTSPSRTVDNPFEKVQTSLPFNQAEALPENRSSDVITQNIGTSVQEEIINQIKERKLYSLDRFETSPTEVSLGWISITKLFENTQLLSRCIDKSIEWLVKLPQISITEENTVFIGIDFWGAIFASQASVFIGVDNYCIGTKMRSQHNILLEKPEFLCEKLKEKEATLKNIIFFTDVISTGNTIISIQDKIKSSIKNANNLDFIAVSIISDTKQTKQIGINNFKALGSLCTSLRLPILKNSDLPSIDILPIKYDIK